MEVWLFVVYFCRLHRAVIFTIVQLSFVYAGTAVFNELQVPHSSLLLLSLIVTDVLSSHNESRARAIIELLRQFCNVLFDNILMKMSTISYVLSIRRSNSLL